MPQLFEEQNNFKILFRNSTVNPSLTLITVSVLNRQVSVKFCAIKSLCQYNKRWQGQSQNRACFAMIKVYVLRQIASLLYLPMCQQVHWSFYRNISAGAPYWRVENFVKSLNLFPRFRPLYVNKKKWKWDYMEAYKSCINNRTRKNEIVFENDGGLIWLYGGKD